MREASFAEPLQVIQAGWNFGWEAPKDVGTVVVAGIDFSNENWEESSLENSVCLWGFRLSGTKRRF